MNGTNDGSALSARAEIEKSRVDRETPTWFCVLKEPTPDFLTRVVQAKTKTEMVDKLTGVEVSNIDFVIQGHARPVTSRPHF